MIGLIRTQTGFYFFPFIPSSCEQNHPNQHICPSALQIRTLFFFIADDDNHWEERKPILISAVCVRIMKRCYPDEGGDGGGTKRGGRCGNGSSGSSSSASYLKDDARAKSVKEEKEMMLLQDAGNDELLAALGYNVRASKMEDVARKLEQLEMAMAVGGSSGFGFGFGSGFPGGGGVGFEDSSVLSHLASETVHYNPSDLNSWLENMLSELNLPPPTPAAVPERIGFSNTSSDLDDLTAIIPGATREKKRSKSSPSPASTSAPPLVPTPPVPPPVVLMEESQEAGICLVHALLGCAEAVHQDNRPLAETLINQITLLATSQGGAMRKVATYFAEALARRIYRIQPSPSRSQSDPHPSDLLEMHFYEAYPYLKFAHFTANQAILEAFAGKSRVHVIDFGIKQGMQWPALIQALALRPGGPPFFRLTGIGPGDNSNALQEVGRKLAQFAESLNVKFEFNEFAANSLADLATHTASPPSSSHSSSAVAVNSVLEFHRLLGTPGSFEKVLNTVKSLKPAILTVVEQEANHNGPVFLDRFTEALHYYSSMFDSLEGGVVAGTDDQDGRDQAMSEEYMGRQICDVVACEGRERKERHETSEKWKERFVAAGFQMAPLGSNAFRQASILLEVFAGGDGYKVEEKDGFLMLDWHTRPLFTASAWRLPSSSFSAAAAVTK